MPSTVQATRRGEFLLLDVELPGRAPEPAGVLLYDPDGTVLRLRLRRDWHEIAREEEQEVLEALAADMEQKAGEMGPGAFLAFLEDSLSNTIRISGREPVLIDSMESALDRLYRKHVSASVLRFRTHLPLYSCRAAAGKWGDQMPVEEQGWIEAPPQLRLREDMFVARVVGRSMEPEIPDGSLCVFRAGVAGSRQGKKVLVENFAESEQGGQRYTVKRYTSRKRETGDGGWTHASITLEPLNRDFEAWQIEEGSECRVLAEFVCVLS